MNRVQNLIVGSPAADTAEVQQDNIVGMRLRQLRASSGLSIRALAEASGLSVNTLSLIENGKISPSVSTLQRAAQALDVPIVAFFEAPVPRRHVIHLTRDERDGTRFEHGMVEHLSTGFISQALHPCVVTLEPHNGSGAEPMVHTGYEFVYCLQGRVTYTVDSDTYLLQEGDSLLFESHLPHRWQNEENEPAQMLLVLAPTDERDRTGHRHFSPADPSG